MLFFIMIGTHSWERLFHPSVPSGSSRCRHLLASWGSWGSLVSLGSWGSRSSRASRRSRGYRWSPASPASPVSPAAFVSRAFRSSQESWGYWYSGVSWGYGGSRVSRASWLLIFGVWLLFFNFWPFKNSETQKQDCKKTYLFIVTDRSDRYLP